MRTIVTAGLAALSAGVAVVAYQAGGHPAAAPAAASASSSPDASTTSASGTYTGDAVQTRWGPVQVQITVTDGTITAATAVQYPQDNPRDVEINSYALPILNQAVVSAQSASIDAVSGATVTSDGYRESLQSALDRAHF